ncbi:MAG: diguanylate cyclase [Spirochaetaceae bacterium]|nr:MAG: diguanylate cyclase [Spirochaetaceae bacterium]
MENNNKGFSLLIVDDQPENIQIAASILKADDLTISYATSAQEALERIKNLDIDLFLLDIMMPEVDGIELCRQIKQLPAYKQIPVIFLTAKTDKETLIRGFKEGAVDYISKPFFSQELIHRVRAQLQLRDALRRMEDFSNELNLQIMKAMKTEEELNQKQHELEEANKALSEWASTDPLTGLLNRRKGWDYLEYEEERSKRSKHCTAVILMDIDHFKLVNDDFGHEEGDRILKTVSKLLTDTLRSQDILIRWGGEEFLAALPETGLEGGLVTAEKIRAAMHDIDWNLPDRGITLSLGVACKSSADSWDEIIQKADQALYVAKDSGRDQVQA